MAVRLRTEGHEVFLDRDDLPEGEGYDARIRQAIAGCELYVFLVSPDAVKTGRYTLTELKFAREQYPNPRGRVLPVMIRATPFGDIPAYLSAVTVLQPEGNPVAEAVARIGEIEQGRRRGRLLRMGTAIGLLAIVLAAAGWWWLRSTPPACSLAVELASGSNTAGLALDVTTQEGTRAYKLTGGALVLDLGPVAKQDAAWSMLLRGLDGGALGEQSLEGCPKTRTPVDFGGGYAVVLVPQ